MSRSDTRSRWSSRTLLAVMAAVLVLSALLVDCKGASSPTEPEPPEAATMKSGVSPTSAAAEFADESAEPGVIAAEAKGKKGKVEVCHIPPGNPANRRVIRVGASAVEAHLGHGDNLFGEEVCDELDNDCDGLVDEENVCTGTLTLVKHVINDDGGTAQVSAFALFVDAQQVTSGVATTLAPGTHTASEINLSGYAAGPWVGDCDASGVVTLAPGDDKVCEITNDDVPPADPRIRMKKSTNGHDADSAPGPTLEIGDAIVWKYVVTNVGNVPLEDIEVTDDQGVAVSCPASSLKPGESMTCTGHGTVTEGPACDGQYSNVGAVVARGAGQTIRDSDPSHYWCVPPRATLTLIKHVVNDDGGTAEVADFALFVDGQQVTSGARTPFPPGTYAASEENVAGYEAGPWVGDCDASGVVTLAPGDDKVCEITNDDVPPADSRIRIEKATNGHDADAAPGPMLEIGDAITWRYVVTNAGNVPLEDIEVTDDQGVAVSCPRSSLQPGQSMTCTGTGTVTEGPACDGQYANVGAVVARAEGQTIRDSDPSHYYCEPERGVRIEKSTNGQDADAAPGPTLEIGDAIVWEYVVTNTGNVPLDGITVTDDQGVAVRSPASSLQPGESMTCTGSGTVTEGPACDGQYSNVGAVVATAAFQTIRDSDPSHYYCEPQPATLKLIKHVINDDGGTAQVSAFALFVDAQQVTSGVATTLPPGTYTASEVNLPGYTAGPWGGDCAADGSVTLALGEHKVCEIVNDDVPQP